MNYGKTPKKPTAKSKKKVKDKTKGLAATLGGFTNNGMTISSYHPGKGKK